jgi:hypothetical protein
VTIGEHFIDHPHQAKRLGPTALHFEAKRLALLTERAELIARTEAFDARWWRVGKCCRYASTALSIAAMALFASSLWAGWSFWLAWGTLITGQAFGLGHSWAAKLTIKRKLAGIHEMAELDNRMNALLTEALRETEH